MFVIIILLIKYAPIPADSRNFVFIRIVFDNRGGRYIYMDDATCRKRGMHKRNEQWKVSIYFFFWRKT